ncbi:hypothetical protein [Salinivibrio kushneri]|uniref:hypothetical protein n=1 Tax=Salinivibrio kushneri TaxID=1908198 RepID=UPI00098931C3|nr:hypothetical protein [Salinivibrio kushneri]OOE63586.1 hypothetical protein BZG19_16145 [Salinivibrio kushneri]
MEDLRNFLSGEFIEVEIDFSNCKWHTKARVPAESGWYYVETNTPFEVLARQDLWGRQYTKKKSCVTADVKNYDLQSRCSRYDPRMAEYWNKSLVYSGRASNLQSRAREHTFADPGTGGLALSKYPELHEYDWWFYYKTLNQFYPNCANPDVLLLLGEQVWRSKHGWPILCAE